MDEERQLLDAIAGQPWLEPVADTLQKAAQALTLGGGGKTRAEDALHGTWLGHPLHPALTDVPLGAWTAALAMDVAEMGGRSELAPGADMAVTVGLLGAMGAAKTGLADWQYTTDRPRKIGTAHAVLNGSATLLYAASLLCRKRGKRRIGAALSTIGYAAVSMGAWLGGEMVYREHIGVDRARDPDPATDWTAVLPANELQPETPVRVDAGGVPVLLVKRGRHIDAIVERCSHMGGPLSEGEYRNGCITCPWHGSTFSVSDGHVVHSPAVYPQPRYEARVRDGQVMVRLAQG